jgi:hypothetical protein
VIVRDLDVEGLTLLVRPLETNTPLIVDPYAVLPSSISAQRLESVPGRALEIEKLRRGVKPIKRDIGAVPGNTLKPSHMLTIGKLLSIAVSILWSHHPVPFLGAG